MTDTGRCPQCGAPLADQAAQGLCPACLVKLGMATPSQSAADNDVQSVADPRLLATRTLAPNHEATTRSELRLPKPGERFGDYLIARTLGQGGMGAVYEAEQLSTGRRVALKVLKHSLDSPEARKRFLREGRLAASINHPNSVYVFGTEEIDGTPAIAMELVAGGTLQERVKQQGPLPIGEAVDVVVQIISGLEAAQRLGVLHRDIKPANCFIDVNGVVKVGDFGLSISTAPRGESDVTHSGSFLGTPAFASPEQLRGDELNIRSDMYSVGVTLYYLLTGRTPFNADNMVKLLATVLERPSESPKRWRAEIPQGLAQVVLRCLQKQPTDRFKTYDELRQALLPFASTAPMPAPLGLRFVAYMVDRLLWILVMWFVFLPMPPVWDWVPISRAVTLPGMTAFSYWLVSFLLLVLFFAVPEGRWGLTAGKWLCRLRVVNDRREPPGIARAFGRAILVAMITAPSPLSQSLLRSMFPHAALEAYYWPLLLAQEACYALLFVSARKRNGLAGLHDLLTGTRVILVPPYQTRTALATSEESLPATQTATIGPYHVLDVIEKNNGEEWILGYDTRLLRRVWVRQLPAGAVQTLAALRNVARPGRLRWLNGKRSPTETWDAYEALTGQPLVKLLDRPWPWEAVRFWLLDLAEELAAAAKDATLPESLSLDRVWITAEGRAKLLDFAPPGLDPLETSKQPTRIEANEALGRRRFLNQVAIAALEGNNVDAAEASTRAVRIPVPIAARNVLDGLAQSGGDEDCSAQLQTLTRQPATVSRRRRLALVSACCLPPVFLAAVGLIFLWAFRHISQLEPDVMQLYGSLEMLDQLKTEDDDELKAKPEDIQALELLIVHRYRGTITDPEALAGAMAQSLFGEAKRGELARIVAAHPNPTDAQVKAAENNEFMQEIDMGMELGFGFFDVWLLAFMILIPLGGLVLVALSSLAAAFMFRRGLLLRTLGIEVVSADGAFASRGRLLLRSIIAWSPLTVIPIAIALVAENWAFEWFVALAVVYAALVIWSLLLPSRGLHDRLAGTWPVPA